jgi:hypothetical protein
MSNTVRTRSKKRGRDSSSDEQEELVQISRVSKRAHNSVKDKLRRENDEDKGSQEEIEVDKSPRAEPSTASVISELPAPRGRGRPRKRKQLAVEAPQIQMETRATSRRKSENREQLQIPSSISEMIPVIDWFGNAAAALPPPRRRLRPDDMVVEQWEDECGVMGTGKGGVLPKYEFKSMWQYMIPSVNSKNPAPWKQDPAAPPDDLKLTVLYVCNITV